MRILVTGDREWEDPRPIYDVFVPLIHDLWEEHGELTLIDGKARGVDTIANIIWRLETTWPYERYPADWNRYGPSAGPRRNTEMLRSGVDFVVGFHDDIRSSKGTKDMLRQVARAGIPGRLFTQREEVIEWQTIVSPPPS